MDNTSHNSVSRGNICCSNVCLGWIFQNGSNKMKVTGAKAK